ncbi:MAG: DUF86 domain-containing protein [Patescibacteria group bacterium]|nr:DUF86 domain-containing protein [Patescibacteria group bacterium]
MDKDNTIFLGHILESINWIKVYVQGMSKDNFFSSVKDQDAVFRRLEIIGEAAKNIDDSFKFLHSNIPWRKMAGLRDKLIHEYFGVSLELTWDTIKKDLPELKKEIEILLK